MKEGSTAKARTMRKRIQVTATDLFAKRGYENTTIDEIIQMAKCSKSTFYHYFNSKEDLITDPDVWDEIYTEWYENQRDKKASTIEQLREINEVFFNRFETKQDLSKTAAVLRYQASGADVRFFLSPNRPYNRILQEIIIEGQQRGEIRSDISFVTLAKMINLVHRGAQLEWCIAGGSFSIKEFGVSTINLLLAGFPPMK